MTRTVALVVGPPGHGVVRHALALADAAGSTVLSRIDEVPPGGWVVLDVTDRLWGLTAEVSGPAVAAALDALRARRTRVAVALHDVPFDGDGEVFERRAGVYRGIVQRSDAVFVCSQVERRRLRVIAPDAANVAILPLPVGPPAAAADVLHRALPGPSVAVLGFVYPGKGHGEVLAAMGALPADVTFVCLGRAADGHDDLATALRAADRRVIVTGFLPDAELAAWLRGTTVPVAPNRVVSASASIATWWAHGRRPLTPDVAYTQEIGRDDTLVRYDTDLAGMLHCALADPASTWLPEGVRCGPTVEQVAAARDSWLEKWSA